MTANHALKEDIRAYWSLRAETFDETAGHIIAPGAETEAWASTISDCIGARPGRRVLELASGTGEVTRVLLALGHEVTGLDFSEPMIARSRLKHRAEPRARFILGDAERTLEDDASYDIVISRHLVWTLTDPDAALREWLRVLKPGGHLLVFDGDYVNLPLRGRLAGQALKALERLPGHTAHRDPALNATHAAILAELPFSNGLTYEALAEMAGQAGFIGTTHARYDRILRAQRARVGWPDWLRTFLYDRFVLHARRPTA